MTLDLEGTALTLVQSPDLLTDSSLVRLGLAWEVGLMDLLEFFLERLSQLMGFFLLETFYTIKSLALLCPA
jgi:hypothetical protein